MHSNNATMSDPSESKKSTIPEWQKRSDSGSSDEPDNEATPSKSSRSTDPPPRAALLDQASKFLQEDEIKNSPTERKIEFLKTKGLTQDEIHKLLDVPSESAQTEAQKEARMEHTVSYVLIVHNKKAIITDCSAV